METMQIESDTRKRHLRLQILESLGINPYPANFKRSCSLQAIHIDYRNVGYEGKPVTLKIFGRIRDIVSVDERDYVNIEDRNSQLQIMLQANGVTRRKIEKFREFVFCGDWIGFTVNQIFYSSDNILTAQANDWHILTSSTLSMSELPLPEANDLQLHLSVEERQQVIHESRITRYIRDFLENQNQFLEVRTPLPETYVKTTKQTLPDVNSPLSYDQLRSEIYLKQLIISGLEAVYEIYEEPQTVPVSHMHRKRMLKCCIAPADFEDMLVLIQQLIRQTVRHLQAFAQQYLAGSGLNGHAGGVLPDGFHETSIRSGRNGHLIIDYESSDLLSPWLRKSLFGLLQGETGVDFLSLDSVQNAVEIAKSIGIRIPPQQTFVNVGEVALFTFNQFIVPMLLQPTIVADYPLEVYPFVKQHRHDLRLVERFEVFVSGTRLASGYTALTDPRKYRIRLKMHSKIRGSEPEYDELCEDFGQALQYGLPPTGGLDLSINALVRLLTGQEHDS